MDLTLREIGQLCKQFRIDIGYYQTDVAEETGYSSENISAFETGRNDNARILLWYFEHGMKPEYLFGGVLKNGKSL